MSDKIKLGIYGGTFNPPHKGHIQSAKAFIKSANLDELLIIPTYIPPHKEGDSTVTAEERLEMSKLAFSKIDKITVSDMEIIREGKSYTYLTLQELTRADRELYFLCGTDMMLTLDEWKCPEIIFDLANICYVRREGDRTLDSKISEKEQLYKQKYNAKIHPIDIPPIEISSSEIRSMVREGKDTQKYLTEKVIDYIKKENLYR